MVDRSVTVTIPDISQLADEDIQRLVRLDDGRWHRQTKEIMRKLGADRLDLNAAWAQTISVWTCPCCRRQKADIARMSESGVLLCRLEGHHDHLVDYIQASFGSKNPKREDDGEHNHSISNALTSLIGLASRFEEALLCTDCNTAEGTAKNRLGTSIDPRFSFTPTEIARFIQVRPNRQHDVDIGVARDIWQAVEADFLSRIAFIDQIVHRISEGQLRRVPSRSAIMGTFSDSHFIYMQVTKALPDLYSRSLGQQILERSISRQGVGRAKTVLRPTLPPSDAEFEAFVAAMQQGRRLWEAAGKDWCCPICERDQRSILRKSKKGGWTGSIRWAQEWLPETDPVNLEYRAGERSSIRLGSYRGTLICQDCQGIATRVQQRNASFDGNALTILDLRELVGDAAPNQDHVIDHDDADRRAEANVPHMQAVQEFGLHSEAASSVVGEHFWLCRSGLESDRAILTLAEKRTAQSGDDLASAIGYVRWLFSEGKRLEAMHKAQAAVRDPTGAHAVGQVL